MPERTNLGEQIGPTIYAEEYEAEAAIMVDGGSGRPMSHVVIHREDARELVKMLRCGLNASDSERYSGNRALVKTVNDQTVPANEWSPRTG
jgi:hypothetical protein